MNIHSPIPPLLFSSATNLLLLVNAMASAAYPGTAVVLNILGQCYVVLKMEFIEILGTVARRLTTLLLNQSLAHSTILTAPAPALLPPPGPNLLPLPVRARAQQPRMATTN